MGMQRYTCGSDFNHGRDIQDDVRHYFGCLREPERQQFYESIPEKNQRRIRDEEARIRKLRARFESEGSTTEAGKLLTGFKKDLNSWRRGVPPPGVDKNASKDSKGKGKEVTEDVEDDLDLNVSTIWYKGQTGWDHPKFSGQFPNQKHSLHKLLFEKDKTKNPLMLELEDDEFRWIHIPANNMYWVEVSSPRLFVNELEILTNRRRLLQDIIMRKDRI